MRKLNRCVAIFVLLSIAAAPFVAAYYVYGTGEEVLITVTDKERIVENAGEKTTSKYLVFSEGETFENTDSILRWKFGSSDVQGELKEGKTYKTKVYGWRIPVLSLYRNIVSVEKE